MKKVTSNSAVQKLAGLAKATGQFTKPFSVKEDSNYNRANITARDEVSLNNLEQRLATQVQNGEVSPEQADKIQREIDTNRGVLNSDWQNYLRNRSY